MTWQYYREGWIDPDTDERVEVCSECGYPDAPTRHPHFRRVLPGERYRHPDGIVHSLRLTPADVADAEAAAFTFELAADLAAVDVPCSTCGSSGVIGVRYPTDYGTGWEEDLTQCPDCDSEPVWPEP